MYSFCLSEIFCLERHFPGCTVPQSVLPALLFLSCSFFLVFSTPVWMWEEIRGSSFCYLPEHFWRYRRGVDLSSSHRCRPHIFRERQALFSVLFAHALIWLHKVTFSEAWVGSPQAHSAFCVTEVPVQPAPSIMTRRVAHGQHRRCLVYAHDWMMSILNNTPLTAPVSYP